MDVVKPQTSMDQKVKNTSIEENMINKEANNTLKLILK